MNDGGIFTGERLVAGDPLFAADFARHLAAYGFAQQLCRGREVLDAGCGDGYGSDQIAQTATSVLGVDRSEITIETARRRYQRANLAYQACDLTRLISLDRQFDIVCNFQVIEHLEDPQPFLEQVRQVLRPDGFLVVITPNRKNSFVENPYHVREYLPEELTTVLKRVFRDVDMQGVCGNDKVMAFERARGVQANRILRFDPLGLRNLIPKSVVEWAYPKLARLVRKGIQQSGSQMATITPADFSIGADPNDSVDLLAICRPG